MIEMHLLGPYRFEKHAHSVASVSDKLTQCWRGISVHQIEHWVDLCLSVFFCTPCYCDRCECRAAFG